MIESIKITSLTDIGANLSYNSVFPVVDLSGTPVTDKANLQIIGNYILSQAGGSNFVQAAQATLAQSVTNAAQPNITSVGTLTSLTVSGNVTVASLAVDVGNLHISGGVNGYVLQTDGDGNLSWTAQTGGGGNGTPGGANTQVQFNNAGSFGGNSGFTFDRVHGALASPMIDTSTVYHLGGVVVENADLTHGATSALIIPSNGNTTVPVQLTNTYGNVTISAGNNASTVSWTFNSDGVIVFPESHLYIDSSYNYFGTDTAFIQTAPNVPLLTLTGGANSSISTVWLEDVADPGNSRVAGLYANPIHDSGIVRIITGNNATTVNVWDFDENGYLVTPGNVDINGNVVTVGPGASELAAGLNNPTLVISDTGDAFIQAAINNVSDIGSADWIAYGHHGNDAGGWSDLGFTSASFSDPDYTITGAGDGYVFVQGFLPGQAPFIGGGNLILATGNEGLTRDIIFATGGFATENEFARFVDSNNMFRLTREGSGIQFFDATIGYIANLGGAFGVDSYHHDVVISTAEEQHTWTFDQYGNLTVPGNIQASGISGFPFTGAISGITTGDPTVVVTVTSDVFPAPVSGQVTISGVVGTTEANGIWYYQAVNPNQFELFSDAGLTTPVDGTTWTGYISGGNAISVGQNDITLSGANVNISTSGGNTWRFNAYGSLETPANPENPFSGRIQTANGYPTLLAYGSGGHGGPEFDWMNSNDPSDFGNASVVRNAMYFNSEGLYIGINENNANSLYQGNWRFDQNGLFTLAAAPDQGNRYTQKSIKGSVETIQGDPFPASLTTGTPILVWTASSVDIIGAKITVRVQDWDNFNVEMFDIMIAKQYPSINVSYSVSNRLKTNGDAVDTEVVVDLDVSNQLTLSLVTRGNGAGVTYSVTEFDFTFD